MARDGCLGIGNVNSRERTCHTARRRVRGKSRPQRYFGLHQRTELRCIPLDRLGLLRLPECITRGNSAADAIDRNWGDL